MNRDHKLKILKAIYEGVLKPHEIEMHVHVFDGEENKWNYDNKVYHKDQIEDFKAKIDELNKRRIACGLMTDAVTIITRPKD